MTSSIYRQSPIFLLLTKNLFQLLYANIARYLNHLNSSLRCNKQHLQSMLTHFIYLFIYLYGRKQNGTFIDRWHEVNQISDFGERTYVLHYIEQTRASSEQTQVRARTIELYESKPIHLGTSKTKAYTRNGARTVYISMHLLALHVPRPSFPTPCKNANLVTQ